MNTKLVWVGPRESDIKYSNMAFDYTVTYNGKNENIHFSYTAQKQMRINQYNTNCWNLPQYLRDQITYLSNSNQLKLMFYNPMQSYLLGDEYVSRTICMNQRNTIELIRNKGKMRTLAQECIPVVPYVQFSGNKLPNIQFKGHTDGTLILQEVISSGGYGTRRMTISQCEKYLLTHSLTDHYIVSPYLVDTIPINVHMIIFDDDVVVFPPSYQILQEKDDHFVYIGADYHTVFSEKAYYNIIEKSTLLADQLRDIGYRGICGIDYLLSDDDILFLEINPRFQASTFLLNKLLAREKKPSAHELNVMAFLHKKCPLDSFSCFVKPASFFTVMGETVPNWYSDNNEQLPSIVDEIYRDGFSSQVKLTKDAYLFRVVTDRNLCWLNSEAKLQLAPNIKPDSISWKEKVLSNDKLALKIGLLNQGVQITPTARKAMQNNGFIRQGVFQSVDLNFPDGMVINAPYMTAFSELSPFAIDFKNKIYILKYYDSIISEIHFETVDIYKENTASNGTLYRHVAFWATDRLRIHHQFRCNFKEMGLGCKFCNVKIKEGSFSLCDVYEIIDFYLEHTDFRHFLIGGGSAAHDIESANIISIAKHIREKSNKSIYVMCLPPEDVSILSQYKNAGINEIGFNIELFNRHIAAEIMPGKGNIPLKCYENAFREAVRLWGRTGNVRSLMVLGLEPLEDFYEGIDWLCRLGVMPIISVFRPVSNIHLNHVLPPSNETLENVFKKVLTITKKYNFIPGPLCTACQNNTLSLPSNIIKSIYMD